DIARHDRTAAGLDPPAGAIRGDLLDRGRGADPDVAAPAGVEQALVVERRMQARRALDHHAAVIIVAGDFLALALARHHGGAGLRGVVETGEALLLRGEVLRRPGAD